MTPQDFAGVPRLEPSPLARSVVRDVFPRREGAKGAINRGEAEFLLTLIEREDARDVVEIGVASGASTLYMLAALDRLGGARRLVALDAAHAYYVDPQKPVGYLASESEFNVAGRFALKPGSTVLDLDAEAAARPFDFAFIDGDHRHPWPTLDFLFLLPWLREGAIVALHDINLPALAGRSSSYGAQALMGGAFLEAWTQLGAAPNIGAFRVPELRQAGQIVAHALGEAWETTLALELRERCAAALEREPMRAWGAPLARFFEA